MNFYDILAAKKWGGGIPTINFFDLLFAQSMGGGEQWKTYEGTLPATLCANGDDMRQYQIYGATGGVGDDSGTTYGYKIDMSVFGNYKRVHEDTVTINGIVWDILGYDHDIVYKSNGTLAQHTVTIQTHESLSSMLFDAREALFAFDNGLSAGTYFFTVGAQPWYSADINKNIQFTLANDIPPGGQLVINSAYNATMINATISAYANSTAITASETVTMIEDNSGLNLGTVDAGLSDDGICNSIQRALLGSNRWSQSAIRQYLNSSAAAGSVWTPQTKWDRPPSWVSNTAGFLHSFDNNFMTVLGTTQKTTALNTITDGGKTETTDDRVFLLSRTEAYAGNEQGIVEGTPYPYYSDFSSLSQAGTGSDSNRKKLLTNISNFEVYWLRTPERGTARTTRAIGKNGEGTQAGSINLRGISPACTIILDDIVSNDWLKNIFLQSETTPIYIGDEPLNKDEYIDYQAGKVYKLNPYNMLKNPTIEVGDINYINGLDRDSTVRLRIVGYIDVTPNTTYCISYKGQNVQSAFRFYAEDNEYLGHSPKWLGNGSNFQAPERSSKIRCIFQLNDGSPISVNDVTEIVLNEGQAAQPYLQPTDPPITLPALPTCQETTIVDYTGESVAPEKVYFEYKGGKQP